VTERDEQSRQWQSVLEAGVKAQRLVPGAIAVGGTAAALYAHHRFSQYTDHLVTALRDRFDEVRERLEESREWKTARVQPPVLILGSIGGVQVGFRQPRRVDAIETSIIQTPSGPLTVPTLPELIGMKAYLLYSRNALRDYLDFAALALCVGDEVVVAASLLTQSHYGHLQTGSVTLEIAKRLCDPSPFDLDGINLDDYKGVAPEWRSWDRVCESCIRLGVLLSARLVLREDES
jgi:hypothetical protein